MVFDFGVDDAAPSGFELFEVDALGALVLWEVGEADLVDSDFGVSDFGLDDAAPSGFELLEADVVGAPVFCDVDETDFGASDFDVSDLIVGSCMTSSVPGFFFTAFLRGGN